MLASPQSLRNAKWQRGKEATGDLIINVQAFLDLCNDVSLHTLKFECNQKVLLLSKHFLMGIYSDLGLFGRGGGGGYLHFKIVWVYNRMEFCISVCSTLKRVDTSWWSSKILKTLNAGNNPVNRV